MEQKEVCLHAILLAIRSENSFPVHSRGTLSEGSVLSRIRYIKCARLGMRIRRSLGTLGDD